MALLLEKCEIATNSIDDLKPNEFNDDAKFFVQQKFNKEDNFLEADQEVNDLVRYIIVNVLSDYIKIPSEKTPWLELNFKYLLSDATSTSSSTNSLIRAREGARLMQRLL